MLAEGPLRHRREAGFHLIETMRIEADGSIARRDLHLARLESAASALGFAFDHAEVNGVLARLPSADEPQRLRVLLERNGQCRAESFPFTPLAPDTLWVLKTAVTRLDSNNPLLRHKTSLRQVYDAARAEFPPQEADEVLLLNEKNELCDGTITSLFVRLDDGPLVTPPLASGALAGVLRADMIERGMAREEILHLSDLVVAREIFVGNALRGLIKATLPGEEG